MYIENYWGNYIGGTDESLILLDYLANKQKEEITLGEIISDSGLDKLDSFKNTDVELALIFEEEFEAEIHYAINLITDLAALLLECKMNGSISIQELNEMCEEECNICITATKEEHEMMNKALADFVAEPLSYDLCEMVDEEDMLEMAAVCEELRKELYEG